MMMMMMEGVGSYLDVVDILGLWLSGSSNFVKKEVIFVCFPCANQSEELPRPPLLQNTGT